MPIRKNSLLPPPPVAWGILVDYNVSNLDFKDWTLRWGNIELNNTEKWQQWNETTEGLNMWEPIGSYPNRFNGTFDGKDILW